jgi:DNA repair protein RecN (Recombination protein N)
MLRSLSVKNFAVVEEATLEFSPGFNVLTGETGAGKSILMEALSFLMGGRGSAGWIRPETDRLIVEAVFDKIHFPISFQKRFGGGEELIRIRREMDSNGKSRAFLQDSPIPALRLAEMGEFLLDFHGQNQHQKLLKTSFQRDWLDSFSGLEGLLKETGAAFDLWITVQKELEVSNLSEEERAEKLDFMRFRLDELEKANLREGEEDEIEAALPVIKNAARLRELALEAYESLYAREGSALAQVLKAERAALELAKIDLSLQSLEESITEARVVLDDAARALSAYQGRLEADPKKLDSFLERLDKIGRLKRKYGKDVGGILVEKENLTLEISRLENRDQGLKDLQAKKEVAETRLRDLCEKLHARRVQGAKRLEKALLVEIKELGLSHAEVGVSIEMEEENFHRFGSDEVEFMFSANPGAPLRPLRETASGGELSRVMLALKTVLAKADRTPVLVFDEVDSGIGGAVARAVGQRLAALSSERQVLCVTHLAQIACLAQNHVQVFKEIRSGRAKTWVENLKGGKRLEAIAVMLGGADPTVASRRHAQELLEAGKTT